MPHKLVRIVIADRYHGHRLSIEKALNSLGCFRIVPTSSLEEACLLSKVDTCPVNLLIFNVDLLTGGQARCMDHINISPRTRFILPYRCNNHKPQLASSAGGTYIWNTIAGVPDFHVLSAAISASESENLSVTSAIG